MGTISALEVRQKLGDILNRVALLKEEMIIERAGKPLAKLTPVDEKSPLPEASGKLDFRKAAGLGSEIWQGVDVDGYLRGERQSWD